MKLVLFILLLLLSCSCKDISVEQVTLEKKITINPNKTRYDVPFSDLFSKIEYLPIPTEDEFLVGRINKLVVTDDLFFVADNEVTHSVFCFDRKGEIVFCLNKKGAGPQEYAQITDIAYDTEKKELIIYCALTHKLIFYNSNGMFIREERTPFNAFRIQPLGNQYVFYCDYDINPDFKTKNKFPNLILTEEEKKGKIFSSSNFFKGPLNHYVLASSEPQFSRLEDTLIIKPDHSDIIYHIIKNEIYPAYQLDFGIYGIKEDYWKKAAEKGMTPQKLTDYCNEKKICKTMFFLEGDKYIYFAYNRNNKRYAVLYSKASEKIVQTETMINDMDGVSLFVPLTIHKDKLYCLLHSEDVCSWRDQGLFEEFEPNPLWETKKELDNPILTIFSLKDF